MAGMGLRDALEQAGFHAMRIRAARVAPKQPSVEMHVLPVGVEVHVWRDAERRQDMRRLVDYDIIEHTTYNVLMSVIDELIAKLEG
jgi:hypothetical protein